VTYLVDSDWIIAFLGGRIDAVGLLGVLEPQGLAISLMTLGEVYEGVYYGKDPGAAEAGWLDLVERLEVLPLDEAVLRRFARLRGYLRQRGSLIGDPDTLIAATALEHDLTLVTRNHRHFRRVPGLRLYEVAA
jgi:tRNA(fMet)-specific endonuclease VapC